MPAEAERRSTLASSTMEAIEAIDASATLSAIDASAALCMKDASATDSTIDAWLGLGL